MADGCWVVHYHDGSSCTPFASELDALRHALDTSATVTWVPWGQSVTDAVKAADSRPEQSDHPAAYWVPIQNTFQLRQLAQEGGWRLVRVNDAGTPDTALRFERP